MTRVYDKNNIRQRLSSLLKQGKHLTGDNFYDLDLTTAATQERVDLLLWPQADEVHEDVDLAGVQIRQKEYRLWHLRMQNALRQVLAALNIAQIPVIVLRGLALSSVLYKEPYMRPQSDIDLMFRPEHVLQAKQALWDTGFRPDSVYADMFVRGEIQLDVHSEPLGIERIKAWQHLTPLRAEHFFECSETGEMLGERALLLQSRINLPYLCFHAMKHSFERLLWLYDIALLSQKIEEQGQWHEVLAAIEAYKLQRPCFYALSYVVEHLNGSVPHEILDAICPDMGICERRLFARYMRHETVPFLAERVFARMQPDLKHRLAFWRETIYPRYEVRQQMANGGCVKCTFIRTRLRQIWQALSKSWRKA